MSNSYFWPTPLATNFEHRMPTKLDCPPMLQSIYKKGKSYFVKLKKGGQPACLRSEVWPPIVWIMTENSIKEIRAYINKSV